MVVTKLFFKVGLICLLPRCWKELSWSSFHFHYETSQCQLWKDISFMWLILKHDSFTKLISASKQLAIITFPFKAMHYRSQPFQKDNSKIQHPVPCKHIYRNICISTNANESQSLKEQIFSSLISVSMVIWNAYWDRY